jgi:hypothetical protein
LFSATFQRHQEMAMGIFPVHVEATPENVDAIIKKYIHCQKRKKEHLN